MLQASPPFYGLSNNNADASVLDMMFDSWNDTPEQKQPARHHQVSHMMPQHQLLSTGSAPLPSQQALFPHTTPAPLAPPPPPLASSMSGSRSLPIASSVPNTSAHVLAGLYQQQSQQAPRHPQREPQQFLVPQPLPQLPSQPPQPLPPGRHRESRQPKSPGGAQREALRAASTGRARTTVAAMIEPDSDDGLLLPPAPPSVSQPRMDPGTSPGNTCGRMGKPGAPGAGESAGSMAGASLQFLVIAVGQGWQAWSSWCRQKCCE